jgi:hypothetical protein
MRPVLADPLRGQPPSHAADHVLSRELGFRLNVFLFRAAHEVQMAYMRLVFNLWRAFARPYRTGSGKTTIFRGSMKILVVGVCRRSNQSTSPTFLSSSRAVLSLAMFHLEFASHSPSKLF